MIRRIVRRHARRRIFAVAAAAALILLLACRRARADEPDLKSPGTRDLTIQVGEDERAYRLHIPPAAQEGTQAARPRPLVIALHGAASTGKQMEAMTGFTKLADQKDFVVVYPDGENRVWRYFAVAAGGKKDFKFIEELIDALVKAGTVDARRVYATGISNGAYMSNALAVEDGDRIAAIAPVAGTFIKLLGERMKPKRAMPVCYWHGTADPIVGYDGTDAISKHDASMSAEECMAWWAAKDGCAREPKVEKLEDKAPDDGTAVQKWTYAGDTPVVFYRIEGGGHTWPGMASVGEKLLGKSSQDIKASEVIWDFFSKCSLPEKEK